MSCTLSQNLIFRKKFKKFETNNLSIVHFSSVFVIFSVNFSRFNLDDIYLHSLEVEATLNCPF